MTTLASTSAERDTPGRVVPGPLEWTPPQPPKKNWWALIGGPLSVLVAMIVVVSQVRLPYVAIVPGGAEPINRLLKVPEQYAHPPKGSFLLTTVGLIDEIGPFDLVRDYFDDDMIVIARRDIYGDADTKQYNREAAQEMSNSKEAAVVLALRTLGYPVGEHGNGALIAALPEGDVPARGIVEEGDVISAIDGLPTNLAQDAINLLQKHNPGDTISFSVTKKDKTVVPRTVRLGSRTETSCTTGILAGAQPCMGVNLVTKDHKFDFPFEVTIDTHDVGGPSAGLAFTLALIDELTTGELTGGRNVAVTGTIDIDGTVGDVGGVAQKTAAVRQAGATLFLVPPGEFAEAKAHAGKRLKVVQVTTLAEALAALRANGGEDPVLPRPVG